MSNHARFSLVALIAALVPGCLDTGDCDNQPARGESEKDVPLTELRASLGENGTLEPSECERLCTEAFRFENFNVKGVHDCAVVDPLPQAGAGGAAGSAAEESVTIRCDMTTVYLCEGRRHANWTHGARGGGRDALGAWLARAASAEQGSVHSFLALREELEAFGAPNQLSERALGAAAEEVRHARMMRILAHRRGGRPVDIPIEARARGRSLLEFAIENATEGCVFEAFAALVAANQAVHVSDEDVRHVMYEIARDEAHHGQLAWDIHAWCASQLTKDELRRVRHAMRRAFRELLMQSARERGEALFADVLGLPSPAVAVQLARALAREALSALGQGLADQSADGGALRGQPGLLLE
ncbi:ferritin-like domain-containing protein [Sorangium sp. So ce426]|uniref:ferritin-like domain-containing protein n=1 Tax=unclassified Sorangium TaxID=2621164 RepID=UPI003F5B3AA8